MIDFFTAVASYVAAGGFGTIGTNLFAGFLPEQPETCLSIIPGGGPQASADPTRRYAFQIFARNPNCGAGLTVISSIHAMFDNVWGDLTPVYRGRFLTDHEPGPYWMDKNKHFIYVLNITFIRGAL